ncbi:MAG TPA: IPT/TIG domain-containing protein, partial [Candidatus Kapabacteria bacterium]|nr:IPT/TIG domain-containing protein [Candidatus Kapabacteria bacterium]
DSLTRLYVKVPPLVLSGPIIVEANGTADSTKISFRLASSVSPVIKDFQPRSGAAGAIVTISGTNFDPNPKNSVVMLGSLAIVPISGSGNQLQFKVPAGATSGPISVLMYCDSIMLNGTFTVVPDSILSFSPKGGDIGTLITVTTNFIPDSTNIIKIGSVVAPLVSDSGNKAVVRVPMGAATAPISITIGNQAVATTNNFVVNPLKNLSFVPPGGIAGTRVTITANIHPTMNGLIVKFGSAQAVIDSVGDSVIVATVPQSAVTAPITVTWQLDTLTSATNFIVTDVAYKTCTVEFSNFPISVQTDSFDVSDIKNIVTGQYHYSQSHTTDTTSVVLSHTFPDINYQYPSVCSYSSLSVDTIFYTATSAKYPSVKVSIALSIDTNSHIINFLNAQEEDAVGADVTNEGCISDARNADGEVFSLHLTGLHYNATPNGDLIINIQGSTISQNYSSFNYTHCQGTLDGSLDSSYIETHEFTEFLYPQQIQFTGNSYVRITLAP